MAFWKGKVTEHFDKILLAVMFTITMVACIHLMHKADAGGDDSGFIVWGETQAAMILGALIGLIKGSSTTTISTEVAPPTDRSKEPSKVESTSSQQ